MIAKRTGILSLTFVVTDGDAEVGRIEEAMMSSTLTVESPQGTMTIERTGMLSTEVCLMQDGATLASATPTGMLSRAKEIIFNERRLTMSPTGVLSSEMELQEEGVYRGRVTPTGILSAEYEVEADESVPQEIQVFVLGLMILQRRGAAAAGAAGAM